MRIFISGGCKNGKSYHALRLAKAQSSERNLYYYIATMESTGAEDDERIARHRRDRSGWGFTTIEQPRGIEEILKKCDPGGSFLLDSVTALLANEMFKDGCEISENAAEMVTDGLMRVIGRVRNIVLVSDYIFSDALIYDPLTELYRKSLAEVDRALASACDSVLEVAYTNVIVHK